SYESKLRHGTFLSVGSLFEQESCHREMPVLSITYVAASKRCGGTSVMRYGPREMQRLLPGSLLHRLEEVERARDRLDDVLVGLVVPVAGHELHGPGAGERPAAKRGAVAVLLHDVEVALVVDVGEAVTARGDRDVLEPVEEVAVLRRAALEGHVGERQ